MRRFYRVFAWLFAVTVVARFVSWIVLVLLVIQDRADLAYPEGARVYAVRRVSDGEPLYQGFRHIPHVMVPYGPLYFEIAGRLDRWFGGDPFDSYLIARGVSFVCFAVLMVLVAIWATEIAGTRRWGVTIAAFAAACPTLFGPSVGAQVDSLAMLASAGALFLAARGWGQWRWCCVWLLALAAWATKQNSVALALALAVWLWQTRGWRPAAAWLLAWLAGIAALWGLIEWTSGGLFTLNTLVSLRRPFLLPFGVTVLRGAAPFVGVLFAGVIASWRRTMCDDRSRLPAWWFLCSVIPGAAACFGEGGGSNYLMESWIAACLLVARLIPSGARHVGLRTTWLALLSVGCMHDAGLFYFPSIFNHVVYFSQTTPAVRRAGLTPNVDRLVRTHPGELFVPYAYHAVISRRPSVVLDVVHYRLMVEGGIVSPDELAGRFARREYALVVLREPLERRYDSTQFMRWPEPVWAALAENYVWLGAVDGQFVYEPAERD